MSNQHAKVMAQKTMIELAKISGIQLSDITVCGGLISSRVETEEDGILLEAALTSSGIKCFYQRGRFTGHRVVVH